MKNKRYYYLRVSSAACGAIAGVNEAPIFLDFFGRERKALIPVNEFILDGKNLLTIDVFPPAGNRPEQTIQSTFEAEVFLADPDQRVPTLLESIVSASFPSAQVPAPHPVMRKIEFSVREYINPVMDKVDKVSEITPKDLTSINNIVNSYFEAIQNTDYAEIIRLNRRKFEILAAVYSAEPSDYSAGIPDQFGLLDAENSSLELECENMKLRPIFDGSVFHADGLDGLGSFRVKRMGTKQSARFNLYLGKYNGEWTILL